MDEDRRAFYEYHAAMMEPWDGPAAVAFTDGRQIGATLDRNGLRPARYIVTDDDLVIMASETGVLTFPEEKIVKKWRLQPGKMFLIDLEHGRIIDDEELKRESGHGQALPRVDRAIAHLPGRPGKRANASRNSKAPLLDAQQAFGYTQEDLKFLMLPMAAAGEEAIGSMGNDSRAGGAVGQEQAAVPLLQAAVRAGHQPADRPDPRGAGDVAGELHRTQAQPARHRRDQPADPARSQPAGADFDDMDKSAHIDNATRRQVQVLRARHHLSAWPGARRHGGALASLCAGGREVGRATATTSSSSPTAASSADHVAIPALLALSAMHQHLVGKGLRTSAGLVVETGSAREVHHFALLAGYGAEAIHPYLALETLANLRPGQRCQGQRSKNFVKAIGKGLLQVMSKMGISTYMSYCGAQIFEAVGLQRSFVDKYFTGTAANVEGIGLFEVAEEAVRLHTPRSAPTRCWPMRSTPAANTHSASAAKSTCGRRTRSPSCSTRRAPASTTPTRNTPASSTTSPSAT